MSPAAHEPATVDGYLTDLAGRLRGPRRARTAILDEIRDGLHETIDAKIAAGMEPHTATADAINELGTPRVVAAGFATELATAHARHTSTALLATGPLVGIWWLLLLDPHPWRTGAHALITAIPAVPLVAAAVAVGVTTLAGTGRLTRWLPDFTATRVLQSTIAIMIVCIVGDLTVLTALAARATGIAIPVALAVTAIAASLIRIACVTAALRRTSRIRTYANT